MTASGLVCGAEIMSSVSTDTMGRAFRAVALATVAASGAQAFSPAQAFSGLGRSGLRQATSARPTLGLRMSENDVEYKSREDHSTQSMKHLLRQPLVG